LKGHEGDDSMNMILRKVLIAASVVTLACGAAACKKADNSSTDSGAATGASGAMSGNAVTSGPMGASGAASTDAASGASQ
jgi:hypothetical protein